ncbi:MAG TPA: NAD(+)/NADH kinase [Gammaproteobacteria bacterium]|nr:NAD(+)/NADH kinase [Gammaproteobacteria bacterium]
MKKIKSLCIFSRFTRQSIQSIVKTILTTCQKHSINLFIEEQTSSLVSTNLPIYNPSHSKPDCFLVIGGDGSMLQAASIAVHQETPLLGINTGKLGFLVDINPEEVSLVLTRLFQNEYNIESRPCLQWETSQSKGIAINEVVIKSTEIVSMANFELIINTSPIYQQQSDGLIISTPTGSTAYSLSAGGPILVPYLPVIVLTPICAHKLNTRPLVISNQDNIIIKPTKSDLVFCNDGSETKTIALDDQLMISKNPLPLKLIHPHNYDYYTSLKLKLGWEKSHAN